MSTGTTSIFTSVFKGLDDDALDTLREVAERRTYPANTLLCRQGAVEHTFYIVVEGQVAIVQHQENGEERLLAICGPRQFFGELGLIGDTERMADCRAITPVTVLEVSEAIFQKVLHNSPAVAYSLIRNIVAIMRANDQQAIADLKAANVELEKAYRDLQAAQAELVEKELLERELAIAADVQRTLLPVHLPQFADYKLASFLEPARHVGGDFFDVLALDEEHVALLLADVADKSVQAALFMAVARTLFMVESSRSLDPVQVAQAVHRGVMKVAPSADIFVTAFYGVLHRPSGSLRYVSAGHERPLLIRRDQKIEKLPGRGRFLGMLETLELQEYSIQLEPGDRILIFSDGLPDAMDEEGRQYGYARLVNVLKANRHLSVEELVARLVEEVNRWHGKAPRFDDLTLLALEATVNHESAETRV
ncbi:MAG: SpoIIE family protein phosphatase [Candidatus Promineifilaceae bacterium]|nr:SpoIIE family protein phosphatase [Candidatus Promineifilaceae bacterium]